MIIKPKLKEFVKKDGTRNIVIYCYDKRNKTKIEIPTEHNVKSEHFNNGKVINRLNADYLNAHLNLLCSDIERHSLKHPLFTAKDLLHFKAEVNAVTLRMYLDIYIKDIESGVSLNKGKHFSGGTIRSYKVYIGYLKEYLGSNDFNNINETFYNNYVNHLRDTKKFKDNTIAKAIKVLKTIMRKGSKYHSNNEYVTFSASYQDVENVALSEFEINNLLSAKLPKHLAVERDRFYISYNLLLRYGDSVKVGREDVFVKDGKSYVNIYHQKTKNQAIIPLFANSMAILKKYKFDLPKTTNEESNWKIKEVCKLAGITDVVTVTNINNGVISKKSFPKYHFITTHTARRSMATNLYLAGFDLKQIQLMGGWKSMAVLEKYLKIDKLQNAIDAGKNKFFD